MSYRDLVTVEEVRAATGWDDDDYTDVQIQTMITDVSIYFETLVGHEFGWAADTTYTFIGDGTDRIEFYGFSMPLATAPDEVDEVTFDSESYDFYPEDGPPYEEITYRLGIFGDGSRIEIKGDWGWEEIPDDVKAIAIRLIRRYAADAAWAAVISGSSSTTKDIQKVDIGEGRASVTFGEASSTGASYRSTGDAIADRLIKRYRRFKLGAVI